jgi:hypothetical protein
MGEADVTAKDRERYVRARARGKARAHDPSAVVEARYDRDGDLIELKFVGGGTIGIPRKAVPGLEWASAPSIEAIVVSPRGDALSWPSLNLDVYVPGLVERTFGSCLFAATTGRRGGRTRSKAKAASKANGAKGRRPRKSVSA